MLILRTICCLALILLLSIPAAYAQKQSKPKASPPFMRTLIALDHLDSDDEATELQQALKELDGVSLSMVEMLSKKVVVAFDPDQLTPELICELLATKGYRPVILSPKPERGAEPPVDPDGN